MSIIDPSHIVHCADCRTIFEYVFVRLGSYREGWIPCPVCQTRFVFMRGRLGMEFRRLDSV